MLHVYHVKKLRIYWEQTINQAKKWCCNCSTLAVFRFSRMHHWSKNTLRGKCMTATLLWTTPSDLFLVITAGKAYALCVSLLAIYPWRTFSIDQNANLIPRYSRITILLSRVLLGFQSQIRSSSAFVFPCKTLYLSLNYDLLCMHLSLIMLTNIRTYIWT